MTTTHTYEYDPTCNLLIPKPESRNPRKAAAFGEFSPRKAQEEPVDAAEEASEGLEEAGPNTQRTPYVGLVIP